MGSKNDLEVVHSVHYCKCGHPPTFHNYFEQIIDGVKTINTSCDHCNCKEYCFDKVVKKKKGDMLGFYNGKWMSFYQIRNLQYQENKKRK